VRYSQHHIGNNRNHCIFQHMLEQNPRRRKPLGKSGADIIIAHLIEHNRPIKPQLPSQRSQNADQNRKPDAFNHRLFRQINNRKPVQLIGKEILSENNKTQVGNTHPRHANHHRTDIPYRTPDISDNQGQADGGNDDSDKHRHSQHQRRHDSAKDFGADPFPVHCPPKIK